MHIRVGRIIRDLNLAIHVAIHTIECIIGSATRRPWEPRKLPTIIRYYIIGAIDNPDFFSIDDDPRYGHRPSQLPKQVRRQRRELADLRGRYVTVLLRALGDTPEAVQASLTRHWQISRGDAWRMLVEDYLDGRLVHRDPHVPSYVHVYPWACEVGGTWIATPRPIRRYLRHSHRYEQLLNAVVGNQPRRGVRVVPDSVQNRLLVAATTR